MGILSRLTVICLPFPGVIGLRLVRNFWNLKTPSTLLFARDMSQIQNDYLKEEQLGHIRSLLSNLKTQEKELEQKEVVTRDDVEAAMREKWQYVRDQELHSKINEVEHKLLVKQAEKDYWLEYKNVGSGEHAKQIKLLENDIHGLKDDLEQMTEYYRYTLETTQEKMDRLVEKEMDEKKEWATEVPLSFKITSCFSHMQQVEIYRKEVSDLQASAQLLEEENIYMIRSLFNCRLQNLKISGKYVQSSNVMNFFLFHRHLFLTQGAGLQVQGEELLSENLEGQQCTDYAGNAHVKTLSTFHLQSPLVSLKRKQSSSEVPLFCYAIDDEQQYSLSLLQLQEYSKLGPLGTKLMTVVGRAMPIHEELREVSSKCQFEDSFDTYKSEGHLTYRMIKSVFT
uniref:Coiled-coil domain containing 83 n=1 Tax=Chelydra serpentina TaxID=8475 RepID=A0A8C3RXC6_CHESE